MLLVDRAIVKISIRVSPIRLNYSYKPLLPIKGEVSTRSYLEWKKARTTSDLLHLRSLQFQRRDEDLAEAQLRQRRKREEGKEYFNEIRRIRLRPIAVDDLVLLHNIIREKDITRSNKYIFKWLGSY